MYSKSFNTRLLTRAVMSSITTTDLYKKSFCNVFAAIITLTPQNDVGVQTSNHATALEN